LIERFGRMMRENFSTGSVPFRKDYLQSFIDTIEIDDGQIRIRGSKDVLEKAVFCESKREAWCSQASTKWRAIQNKTENSYVIEIAI
jgi:site-specific DNA recombinase